MENKEKADIKFSERISLKFRKIIIVSKLFTILTVLVLIAAFIGINLWTQNIDLPEIDVTTDKIYTLSDSSKIALQNLDQDVKIYVFGINEDSAVVDLIKQYCKANDRITYEMLSGETNLDKVQEFELEDGYSIVVVESEGSHKIIDASSEFLSYDYTTYQQVDTTEQTLTNSILSLSTENKTKVYFVQGHDEYTVSVNNGEQAELGVLSTYLKNEAFDIQPLYIASSNSIPEDCSVLAIMSPTADFLESEADAVIEYINKGGDLFITKDVVTAGAELPNFQRILDQFGVSVKNGYIVESDSNYTAVNSPYVFRPQISGYNEITSDIYSDSYMWLAYAQKLEFASQEELDSLSVYYEQLLGTTDSAIFVTDFSTDISEAASTAEVGEFTVAALVTKTLVPANLVTGADKSAETKAIEARLVICANGQFITDYITPELSNQYPLSYLGGNKDFAINSIASLADREDGLTIRKTMGGASFIYTTTESQTMGVLAIIFIVPVLILILGIAIWKYRKKRK